MSDFFVLTAGVKAWALYVLVIATVLWVFFWFKIWQKFGKEHSGIKFTGEIKEPPTRLPPAVVELLMSQGENLTVNSLSATIFDLARRGVITIESRKNEYKGYINLRNMNPYSYILHLAEKDVLDKNNFLPHEAHLINFIFSQATDHTTISIEKLMEIKENDPLNFKNVISDWMKKVTKDTESYNFVEPQSKGWRNIFLICNSVFLVIVFVLSVIITGVYDSLRYIHGILALGPVAAIINGSLFLRWSKNARGEVVRWESFRKYLENVVYFREELGHGAMIWEDVWIYGMVLGITKSVSEYLPMLLNQKEAVLPVWFCVGSEDGQSVRFDKFKGGGVGTGASLAASLMDMFHVFTNTFDIVPLENDPLVRDKNLMRMFR